jgi:ABC-type transport system substrate-binding protein
LISINSNKFPILNLMKFPTLAHWKQFFKIISRKEKISFFAFLGLAVVSLVSLAVVFYMDNTKVVPADNGIYTEGIVGQPRFLNPIYSDSNGADRDITELLFAGLLEYGQNGQVNNGLADYRIADDGKTYEFFLKDDLKWSDGEPITADDAIYTIKVIQDPAYKSPLRTQWIGVETEKISDSSFRLKLKDPYAKFLEYCTLKIIPEHAWAPISAENFPLSDLNLHPVASGPYLVQKITSAKDGSISTVSLERNPSWLGTKPHLKSISFDFFDDYASLAAAFKRGRVQGFVSSSDVSGNTFSGAVDYTYTLPRYYAIFFNQEKNDALADAAVRKALNYAINKQEIIEKALNNRGVAVDSPVLPAIYGIDAPQTVYNYDPQKASQLLDDNGYAAGAGGVRSKTVSRNPAFQFTKNLTAGSSLASDIKELQKCLIKEVMPDLDANGNFGLKTTEAVKQFQIKYRSEILDPQGLKEASGDVKLATREKLNQVCFPSGDQTTTLTVNLTVADQEPFVTVAQMIKAQWASIGVTVNVEVKDITALERDTAKPRDYEALLFGQALGMVPDPYPFWHSTQKDDPGLNFALYKNDNADKLLEAIRQSTDMQTRNAKLNELQNTILDDAPAVFLYNAGYVYTISQDVKNISAGVIADPGQRFAGIGDWYISTKRVWK